jgi:hypothetical protein
LIIRQAVGVAVLEYYKENQRRKCKEWIDVLETALNVFRPSRNIRNNLEILFEKAINLANLMTEEQALFRCTVVKPGRSVDEEYMVVPDDSQFGSVLLCTFPVIRKQTLENGKEEFAPVVRAEVELESAFS